jgi:quercetin dioxygenase-like cupin family protein
LRGLLQSLDLAAEAARLCEEKELAGRPAQRRHLAQERGLNVVRLVMNEGDRLEEHSAARPITLSVQEGRVRFVAASEMVEAGEGTVLACEAGCTTRSRLRATPYAS